MGYFNRRWLWTFRVLVVFATFCFSIATAVFTYHAYLTISRYMKHEILQSSITIQNQSLFMPVVSLQLDTYRNNDATITKPPIEMKFDVSVDNVGLPLWAFYEWHSINLHFVTANAINTAVLQENFTLEDAKSTVFTKILHR